MKKRLLTVLNLLAFITVFSQSGIGTHTPEGALDISYANNEWGLVLPQIDQAANTKNPTGKNVKKGTVIYDLKENCIKYFNGEKWSGCLLAPIADPIKLQCSSAVLNHEIIVNYPVSSQTTLSIPYSNIGEALGYNEIVIQSKGVTGLKATLSSGYIKKGSGDLVFSISGTPSTYGDAKFSLSIAGIDCEFVITVKSSTDIEAPIKNFACDVIDQLGYVTLKGKHIIDGKEVTIGFSGTAVVSTPSDFRTCNVATVNNSITMGRNGPTILVITFSRPVTNIGVAFNGADNGEEFTFTINDNQPIELSLNSDCQDSIQIINNKVKIPNNTVGGNITVGGKWFTELTIQHNGKQAGALFGFCLNNSDAL